MEQLLERKAVVVRAERAPIKGVVCPGPHQIYRNPRVAVETRALGALAPDQVRLQMIYAGLCGSDVHVLQTDPATGYIRGSAPAEIPREGRVIGHEGVGRIIALGSQVRQAKLGAVVAVESILVCHGCDVCRRGQFNQCQQAQLLGLQTDGLFSTIVDVPALATYDVTALATSDQGLRAAACLEPAGVAYVACQNAQVAGGDEVVVFGAGPIGLFCALLSKRVFGASRVRVVEPERFRRELALRWADAALAIEEFFADPKRVDVVFEASGVLDNVTRVVRRLNANGRVVLLGRSGEALHLEDVDSIITNQIKIVGSRGHLCGAYAALVRLLGSRQLPLEEIVTQVVDGPEGLLEVLSSPQQLVRENCKVLARLGD